MEKTVVVDFWDVLGMDNHPFDLFQTIEQAGNAPFAARLKTRGIAQKDLLAQITPANTAISGTAALIRIEDWPKEVELEDGELAALELATSKALAEEMSFRFDRQLRVLVTQRHRLFRASRLVRLLQEITGHQFIIQPILRNDGMARFNHMNRIGKITLKYQGGINPRAAGTAQSVADLLDAARSDIHATDIKVELSMRLRKESLAGQKVREFINRFVDLENTRGLTVSGNEGDTPMETVDFINDRLVFSDEVEYADKHLDHARCQQLLAISIESQRNYLSAR